jgi:hypothetical protein
MLGAKKSKARVLPGNMLLRNRPDRNQSVLPDPAPRYLCNITIL